MQFRANPARRRAIPIIRSPSHSPPDAPNDLVAAGLWVLAVVPPAIGFWLVAGDLAGVDAHHVHQLLVGSLLTCGLGTVLAVLCGFRMPIYEGPAAAYLAAIAVVSAHGHHGVAQISGGLLVAGGFVALLALLRVDRLMQSILTPLVASLFVLIVTLAVMPATVERAIGATHGLPGNAADWISSLVVVGVTLSMRRVTLLSPYSLLAALLAGTACHLILAGVPHATISGGLVAPILLPWGAPSISIGVAIPFLVAGALAAFNTVATGEVVAGSGVLDPGVLGARAGDVTGPASADHVGGQRGTASPDRAASGAGVAYPDRASGRPGAGFPEGAASGAQVASSNRAGSGAVVASSNRAAGPPGPALPPRAASGAGVASPNRAAGPPGPALPPRAAWRALLTHGVAQAGGALLGNVVGTVSRLDSLGIVRLLRNPRRTPLVLAGAFIAVLALVRPVVDLAAAIPLSVSAALLGVILGVILAGMLRTVLREPRRTIMLVAVPSLVPTAVWIVIGSSLPPDWQLVVNPLFWGVVLAVVLERLVDGPAGLDAELALEATARS